MFQLIKKSARSYRYVFIFTYGRSGSTLLMGILNSLPHYCIRGENGNVLYKIYEAYAALRAAHASSLKNSEKATNPWFGLHEADPERFANRLVEAFVTQVLSPGHHRTTGFKEIRFSEAETPDFDGYFTFVREHFPGCRIIFNHRNLDDVAASKWWSSMPLARQKLQVIEDRFNSIATQEDVFHFHYGRIDDKLDHVRELFLFLREPFNEMAVRAVLEIKHSY
ncbi:sulfotransferase [Mesorhizobium sp. B2-5-9]|uniref:sulfotransferase n=1 Tax=Mesorhizobium sp. B2-5-9 TaxID=2589921 RepID=UPI00112A56C2|nr:sulfotransferase [Mesorhizobium sp. B2-5-9]TPJ96771.1 sulfotransferase [Mesorhizobium sp. B2-5-9]